MSQFGVILLMFACVIGMVGLIKFLAWLTDLQERGGVTAAVRRGADRYVVRRESVREYQGDGAVRNSETPAQLPRLSVETKPDQTPDQTETTAERRKKMLDTCIALKRRGFSRDEARALLKPWGIPLDNNIWAQVPPEPEPEYTTPIAGRATSAQFETDPELQYQAPPN